MELRDDAKREGGLLPSWRLKTSGIIGPTNACPGARRRSPGCST